MATLALDYTIISNPAAVDGGVDHTVASKINNHGEVGGYYELADDSTHGFYLNNGEFADITAPGVDATEVFGVNDAGDLVGMTFFPRVPRLLLSSYSAGVFSGGHDSAALSWSAAQDINNAPAVVGVFPGRDREPTALSSRRTEVSPSSTPPMRSRPLLTASTIRVIVVGTYQTADQAHGFVYDGTDFFDGGCAGSRDSRSRRTSTTGARFAGFYVDNNGNTHGFVFAEGNFYTIEAPTGVGAIPGTVEVTGINNLGQVVGTYATDGFDGSQGFVDDARHGIHLRRQLLRPSGCGPLVRRTSVIRHRDPQFERRRRFRRPLSDSGEPGVHGPELRQHRRHAFRSWFRGRDRRHRRVGHQRSRPDRRHLSRHRGQHRPRLHL